MSESMAEVVRRELEESNGLSWFVRALLLVGRDAKNSREQIASLETLQSMLGSKGDYPELLSGLEVVKRSIPGFAEYLAEIDAVTPPELRDLQARLASPHLTERDRERLRAEAARLFVGGATAMSADAALEALTRLADPMLPEEAKRHLREQLTRLLSEKADREST